MKLTPAQLADMATANPLTPAAPVVSLRAFHIDADGVVTGEVAHFQLAPEDHSWVHADEFGESEVGRPLAWPRRRRGEMLAGVDWMHGAHVDDATKAAHAVYRRALLDLPGRFPDPRTIVWPVLGATEEDAMSALQDPDAPAEVLNEPISDSGDALESSDAGGTMLLQDEIARAKAKLMREIDEQCRERIAARMPVGREFELLTEQSRYYNLRGSGDPAADAIDIQAIQSELSAGLLFSKQTTKFAEDLKAAVDRQSMIELTAFVVADMPWPLWGDTAS